jgi:DNA-binding transcriptional regulator YhcF (GntR family)
VPPVRRTPPAYLQVAGYYRDQITVGRLRPGERLPSMRDIAAASSVAFPTAQRAIAHLHTEGLVRSDATGTYVAEPRAAIGPQQRLRLSRSPQSETVAVISARMADCPAYIIPVLGGDPLGSRVIRREEVTSENGVPVRLAVTWYPPQYALSVPELLEEVPLPDPRGGAAMLAARTGADVTALAGTTAFECRQAKDDGRERELLRLDWSMYVLAGVWTWATPGPDGEVIEYGEYILPPGRVIETVIEP